MAHGVNGHTLPPVVHFVENPVDADAYAVGIQPLQLLASRGTRIVRESQQPFDDSVVRAGGEQRQFPLRGRLQEDLLVHAERAFWRQTK